MYDVRNCKENLHILEWDLEEKPKKSSYKQLEKIEREREREIDD